MPLYPEKTQVVYVPPHLRAEWDDHVNVGDYDAMFDYPNGCQPGFIASEPKQYGKTITYFVRYWIVRKGIILNELRTKANSEQTEAGDLVVMNTVDPSWVNVAYIKYVAT